MFFKDTLLYDCKKCIKENKILFAFKFNQKMLNKIHKHVNN